MPVPAVPASSQNDPAATAPGVAKACPINRRSPAVATLALAAMRVPAGMRIGRKMCAVTAVVADVDGASKSAMSVNSLPDAPIPMVMLICCVAFFPEKTRVKALYS